MAETSPPNGDLGQRWRTSGASSNRPATAGWPSTCSSPASRPLPASVEVSAFRIVQEALTNVRRHAAASQVDVRLRYGTDALEISVEDDGVGTGAGTAVEGHGLRGMRERAAMLGGALSVGPLDAGGYRVSVILPYTEP